jgi:hypothetical protein
MIRPLFHLALLPLLASAAHAALTITIAPDGAGVVAP